MSFKSKFQQFGHWLGDTIDRGFRYTPWGVARQNTDLTNKANRELAEYQYSKDLEMWERANEYNSPAAQMERYKAAGLNPNLAVTGGNPGNVASTLPKYQAPTQSYNYRAPVDLGSLIGLYQNVQMKSAQIENVQAQTRATDAGVGLGPYARSEFIRAQASGAQEDVYKKQALRQGYYNTGKDAGPLFGSQHDFANAQMRKLFAESEKKEAETLFKRFENEWMRAGVTRSDHPMIRRLIRGWNASGVEGPVTQWMKKKWND